MAKMRIYELAKELGESNPELDAKTLNSDILKFLQSNGSEAKSPSSGVTEEEAESVRAHFCGAKSARKARNKVEDKAEDKAQDKAEGKPGKKKQEQDPDTGSENRTGARDDAETAEAKDKEKSTDVPAADPDNQNAPNKKAPSEGTGRPHMGKLRGKGGQVIIYRVDESSGRLINTEDESMLPFVMGKDGNIYRLDGTPLAKTGSREPRNDAQRKAAPQTPINQVFDGRSAKDRRNAGSAVSARNSFTAGSAKNHKGALTDALGDKMKAFESQLNPDNENYVPEKKEKKKQVIELPPKPEPVRNEKTEKTVEESVPAAKETVTPGQDGDRTESRSGRDYQPDRYAQGDRAGYRQGDRSGDRSGYRQGDRNSDRPGYRQGDRPGFRQGDRPGYRQGDRQNDGSGSRDYGNRPRRDGYNDRDGSGQGRNPQFGDRSQTFTPGGRDGGRPLKDYGSQGRGSGMPGRDNKDSDQKRSFNKRNDGRNQGGSIKSELGNEFGKDKRAENLKDRSRDKNRKDRNRDYDDDGLKNAKNKKDPNRKGAFQKPVTKAQVPEEEIKTITIPEVITIKELADKMKQNSAAIIKKLFLGGKMVNVNSEITFEEAEEIALEYEIICEKEVKVNIIEELLKETEEDPDTLVTRPPVVCVMGHVDHGKTSLLDAIRKTNVTAREAGGITQHIGAYMVEINGRKITFLDTPGHEAFTSMRMRGAKSTDIAILVVAADDGVMPQTVEAINHAKAANVSIIVAVNKIDKPGANIDRVKQELTEHGLVSEDWGGDTVFVPVSAKTGEGIENLLEMVLLTADVLELKANPDRRARGIVIEAQLDKGRGPVATVLIQKGTLNVGDNVAIGATHGKVRAMVDDNGRKVKTATPSTPVEILGLNGVPQAGEVILSVADEKEARTIAEAFIAQSKEQLIAETKARLSLDGLFSQIQAGEVKELNIIVKADVMGSVEAVKQSLVKLSNEEVVVRVIHGGVGNINESDVTLASASNAIIIGFNVKPDNTAKDIAEHEGVDIKLYKVIYDAINDIEAAMKGMLKPVYEEKVIGHAEIRQLFKASGIGVIAGSYVLDGKIVRGCSARIYRGGEQIFEGNLASLKRFKDDVKEVAAGYECGLVFEKFSDIAELDQAEFYVMEEVPRK